MRQILRLYFLLTILLYSCQQTDQKQEAAGYTMKNYLDIIAYNEQMEKNYQATGKAIYPYIIEISKGHKKLIFVGTRHTREITQQADSIDHTFWRLGPQVAFNEGGQVTQTYASRDEAIRKNAETGQLKYLCDSLGIQMQNGDLDVATEVNALFEKYGRAKVLLYLANERFFDLYVHNWIDTTAGLEKTYQKEFIEYLQNDGVVLKEEEKPFSYIQKVYQDFFNQPLNIYAIPAEKFYFLSDGGELTEIGRSSKVVRDVHLLGKIEEAFKTYDRVFVVFGGAHAFVVEPALHQIMEKQTTR
ncbi:hypothetical protein GXP67_18385 [Rhodocytophaga rosea]|uniref:Uncharacterized protein n=1 Tax=Rhodocytophaga rosea TaxID=2704465 RepID=A0A6C0GKH9_9BACT|nr:hypothetical protein [Rhodocytophaga rosea]QHT68469.1 hypothetical protein GXP67_18385 [Rhodocytophaga rosea]